MKLLSTVHLLRQIANMFITIGSNTLYVVDRNRIRTVNLPHLHASLPVIQRFVPGATAFHPQLPAAYFIYNSTLFKYAASLYSLCGQC
jgi:hypothetical protein